MIKAYIYVNANYRYLKSYSPRTNSLFLGFLGVFLCAVFLCLFFFFFNARSWQHHMCEFQIGSLAPAA